jgi:hypothetical protein
MAINLISSLQILIDTRSYAMVSNALGLLMWMLLKIISSKDQRALLSCELQVRQLATPQINSLDHSSEKPRSTHGLVPCKMFSPLVRRPVYLILSTLLSPRIRFLPHQSATRCTAQRDPSIQDRYSWRFSRRGAMSFGSHSPS